MRSLWGSTDPLVKHMVEFQHATKGGTRNVRADIMAWLQAFSRDELSALRVHTPQRTEWKTQRSRGGLLIRAGEPSVFQQPAALSSQHSFDASPQRPSGAFSAGW